MRRSVFWSRDALDDLDAAIRYIAEDNVEASRAVELRIRQAGEWLGEFASGHPGRNQGVYEKKVARTRYILAYRIGVFEDKEAIMIVRAIHSARDWPEEDWPQ